MAQKKKIEIFSIPCELGAGTRGASMGPSSIRIAGFNACSNFFFTYPIKEIPHNNIELFHPIKYPYAKRLEPIINFSKKISRTIYQSISKKNIPIILSGDHSLATGVVTGIKKAIKKSKLGIIWIDAHADLHTPYTTPSGNIHGMSLAAMLQMDNTNNKVRNIHPKVKKLWENYKNLISSTPPILPEDIVLISLRDYEEQEESIIKEHNIAVISTEEVEKRGMPFVVKKIFTQLQNCDNIYISFDVDCLDSNISQGTGTPSAHGLKNNEAEKLVTQLMKNEKICCFEMCEINPTLDAKNVMSEIAFSILQKGVKSLLMN